MTTSVTLVDRIIGLREVMTMTGPSRSRIYLLMKKRSCPAQVKLSTRSSDWFGKRETVG